MYIISACLCGVNCKYSGKNNLNDRCLKLFREGRAVLVCPEQLGGLPTPRNPVELNSAASEVLDGNGKALSNKGEDFTKQFIDGAYETLKIAKELGATKAILKEGSPSCGSNFVYDGTFTGNKIEGKGITALLLENEGITVFSDEDLEVNNSKLVYLNEFDREKAKKRRLFEQGEEEESYGEEYFDLTENLTDMSELPPSVEENVKKLMISLARDLMGFEEIDEIAEATGLSVEEVEEILEEE
ncbi:DUF523 domain-containing protein [Clostridium beijerinckii]|uniref:Purine-nucleoside phosphorylase n=1 Tax=Clostridium beijerinckii TaxID=1520 RepID=A0A0B5Q9N0_CLOBE|nr:DUF523 domain-containing protein [Clostridium beijerinckii]AJG97625.1 purine-nucleoside phosphorylase [Clostridium beijerinckii]AQS03553.1 hypothetical protein CLBIJ_09680 [Clostridium beijerinckii]MBA2884810.1 uncharacterized protein YbbK (DUF523 family) [Clostridium beijerinckii]MBA2899532.1 uncharacterized protein YbbK (DUF523 family) [Clostridium beijerinckii]MBA2909161.1 uncharacterized protein YbbK (DUF523 family) [Clostridium beijerinckii]